MHPPPTSCIEQCYLWHPPHRGFSQVWMAEGETNPTDDKTDDDTEGECEPSDSDEIELEECEV